MAALRFGLRVVIGRDRKRRNVLGLQSIAHHAHRVLV
jgi:hypothetical protein